MNVQTARFIRSDSVHELVHSCLCVGMPGNFSASTLYDNKNSKLTNYLKRSLLSSYSLDRSCNLEYVSVA